ncbi:MAG: alpha/beta fold hydrolase [Flavobacteriaceae bacterium]
MNSALLYTRIVDYTTQNGFQLSNIQLSYQLFGQKLGTAPVVMVNHALTGNSSVTGNGGWWQDLIGNKKPIDTNRYTIIAFNIPGNGYDDVLIDNYQDFVAKDIANLFLLALNQIGITKLFAIIGGSLGGGIAWEMVALKKDITQHLIPIASDWKSTDWLIANCLIQQQFLLNSSKPIHDARMHAMMCYRSPESYKAKFNRSINEDLKFFNVESWLFHHGKKLQERFQLSAYKMMNHLLRTIEATSNEDWSFELNKIEAKIHILAVDSDLFFTAKENQETYQELSKLNSKVTYHEIISIHGHDAFLIEFDQLEKIIKPIFLQ